MTDKKNNKTTECSEKDSEKATEEVDFKHVSDSSGFPESGSHLN